MFGILEISLWNLIVAILTFSVVIFVAVAGYFHYIHQKYDHIPGPPRDR